MGLKGMYDPAGWQLQAVDIQRSLELASNDDGLAQRMSIECYVIGARGQLNILARRQVDQLGKETDFGQDPFCPNLTGDEVRLPHELCDETGFWMLKDPLWGTNLLQVSLVHYGKPVAHKQGFFLVMSNEDCSGVYVF
jgi:hypothetical protein